MKFNKIDLSNLIGISHDDNHLKLLIDRGEELEYLEIPAPFAAYEGLQQLEDAIAFGAAPSAIAPSPLSLTASLDDDYLLESGEEIDMLPVVSNMAEAVGYDHENSILQIEFKNGAVYQFESVDEETWEDLQYSDSVGRFFNEEIKGNYKSRRIDY